MGKNCKVLGMSVNPISEKQVTFFTSDGRVYVLDLLENGGHTKSEKLYAVPSLHSGGYIFIHQRQISGNPK